MPEIWQAAEQGIDACPKKHDVGGLGVARQERQRRDPAAAQ